MNEMTSAPAPQGTLVVENLQEWFGNQNLGAFHVAVDGKRAGAVLPRQQVALACSPGSHVVRIRRWWYRSAPLVIEVQVGDRHHLVADVKREGALLVRILTTIFRPSRALTIERT
jgi:hypothetical protein